MSGLDLLRHALAVDGGAAGVLLDLWHRQDRLAAEVASVAVSRAFDWCAAPGVTLPPDRWVALFRMAGYTHEHERAERPGEPLTLYRGAGPEGREGLCWTTNLDVARRFAFDHTEGAVYVATVEPERLLATLAPGHEDQHVVDTVGLTVEVHEVAADLAELDWEALESRLDEAAGMPDDELGALLGPLAAGGVKERSRYTFIGGGVSWVE